MKVRARGCCGNASHLNIQDEGEDLGGVTVMNFVGTSVEVSKEGDTATVTITAATESGGGGSSLIDWPISSGAPTGSPKGTRYYLTGPTGVILGEEVAEGSTMEARVDNASLRSDWYFNFGGT